MWPHTCCAGAGVRQREGWGGTVFMALGSGEGKKMVGVGHICQLPHMITWVFVTIVGKAAAK